MSSKDDDECQYGRYHYQLCEASSKGDYKTFMAYANKEEPTLTDLNWCMHDCHDLRILKYICETRKYDRMLGRDYMTLLHTDFHQRDIFGNYHFDLLDVIEYHEQQRPYSCLALLSGSLLSMELKNPKLREMYFSAPHRMLKCKNRKRRAKRRWYMWLMERGLPLFQKTKTGSSNERCELDVFVHKVNKS